MSKAEEAKSSSHMRSILTYGDGTTKINLSPFPRPNYRSGLHLQQVQPKLLEAGIREGAECHLDALSVALGPLLYTGLQRATEQVIYNVDRTVSSLDELKSKMVTVFKEVFPEGDFLNFELTQESANNRPQSDGLQPSASGHR